MRDKYPLLHQIFRKGLLFNDVIFGRLGFLQKLSVLELGSYLVASYSSVRMDQSTSADN